MIRMPPNHCVLKDGQWSVTTHYVGREVITGRRVYKASREGDDEPETRRVYAQWTPREVVVSTGRGSSRQETLWSVRVLGEAALPIEARPSPGMTRDDRAQDDGRDLSPAGCGLFGWFVGTVILTWLMYLLQGTWT